MAEKEFITKLAARTAIENYACRDCVHSNGKKCEDCEYQDCINFINEVEAADVQPIDKDSMHIVYIGRKAYLAENTIIEFMKKMDNIRDSLDHIESYFDTYAETIQQINACFRCYTDFTDVQYFIDRIKENCGYD